MIPPDTRVDPPRLPDDEFPVICPKCAYDLRGLPDDSCPECGQPFDRGRLLVEQYLLLRDIPLTLTGKLARAGALVGSSILILAVATLAYALAFPDAPVSEAKQFRAVLSVALATGAGLRWGCKFMWLSAAQATRASRQKRSKSVLEALDWNEPGLLRAQRLRWIDLIPAIALVSFLFAFGGILLSFPTPLIIILAALVILIIFRAGLLWSWRPPRKDPG